MTIDFRHIESHDVRLGRHVLHDSRSLDFPANFQVDPKTWRTKTVTIYDPKPNPNQTLGNCTTCSKCMQLNTVNNRKRGQILGMGNADAMYHIATSIDPFQGTYPPDDTGSNGLSAAKAAQKMGLGGLYTWLFGGADEVVQAIMAGWSVSVGTAWENKMFDQDSSGLIHRGGGVAGGHQYTMHGYNKTHDWIKGRCWWGGFRDFYIARKDLNDLLADDGDAHIQEHA